MITTARGVKNKIGLGGKTTNPPYHKYGKAFAGE
jgi:hypothetical protein